MIDKTAGREVLGALGSTIGGAATDAGEKSPVKAGGIAFLAVIPEEVVVFRGKPGAFKPKPTEEVLGSAPRAEVTAAVVKRKAISGILKVSLGDDQMWEFDVPRNNLKAADRVAKELS